MKLEETPQTASTFGARPIEQPGKILRFVTGRNLRALVSEWLTSKHGLVWLLLIVFLANYGETWFETSSRMQGPITATEYESADAAQQFEAEFVNFQFNYRIPRWAVYLHSISYYFFCPILVVAVLVALALREDVAAFRSFCLAVAANYLVSLPFFLLFPVPERWTYPESNAVLLSDQWSSALIQALRSIKALNNSFPSSHASLTVIAVAACWLFQLRLRYTATALGFCVILATFALGIDWLAGILGGVLAGVLSIAVALRSSDGAIIRNSIL